MRRNDKRQRSSSRLTTRIGRSEDRKRTRWRHEAAAVIIVINITEIHSRASRKKKLYTPKKKKIHRKQTKIRRVIGVVIVNRNIKEKKENKNYSTAL